MTSGITFPHFWSSQFRNLRSAREFVHHKELVFLEWTYGRESNFHILPKPNLAIYKISLITVNSTFYQRSFCTTFFTNTSHICTHLNTFAHFCTPMHTFGSPDVGSPDFYHTISLNFTDSHAENDFARIFFQSPLPAHCPCPNIINFHTL